MITKEQLTDRIKSISGQISGDVKDVEKLFPEYHIKGTGESFFFSYIDRNFVKLARGMKIFIVAEKFDIKGKTLVYTITHELILIDPDEIEYLGFN